MPAFLQSRQEIDLLRARLTRHGADTPAFQQRRLKKMCERLLLFSNLQRQRLTFTIEHVTKRTPNCPLRGQRKGAELA